MNYDQIMIRDTAEAFLADAASSTAVRAASQSARGYDEDAWAKLAGELGWCATAVPEQYGGLGLTWFEMALLTEQCGRRLLCSPFFSTACLAAPLLIALDSQVACEKYLPDIASGLLTATVAVALDGLTWNADTITNQARQTGHGYLLSATFSHVVEASAARLLLVPARLPSGELGLFAVDSSRAGVGVTPLPVFDKTRSLATVALANVEIEADLLLARGDVVDRAMRRASTLAMIALAAEQVGSAQQCLDVTTAYTKERVQFGRPIASFQAVKHRCAEMLVKIELARGAVYAAAQCALAADRDDQDLRLEAACAKALASEAHFFCAQEAIQLHGGVGFAWEYDPQLHFKRAQASGHWFGSLEELKEACASALLDHDRETA